MDDLGLLLERNRRRRRLRSGSLASGSFIIIAIPLAMCGLALPWWVGQPASVVVEESAGVDGEVGLWTFQATTSIVDLELGATVRQTYESSWDTICAEGRVAGIKCHGIRLIRFLVFAEIGTLGAALLAAVSACGCLVGRPSLLFLLTAALVSLGAAGTAAVALFLIMTIGIDGLQGVGAICHLASLAMGLVACSVAVYAASKAGQEPQKEKEKEPQKKRQAQGQEASRIERFEKARKEAEAVRERLEAFHLGHGLSRTGQGQGQTPTHAHTDTLADTHPGLADTVTSRLSTASSVPGRRKLPALKSIISLAEQQGVEFDFPIPLLEAAFLEIDEDGSGRINATELGVCLRACKLKASDQAVRMVMDDMDADRSGDVDIFEFVAFFHMLQDANRKSQKMQVKNEVHLWGCRACLVVHIFGLTMLLILLIQMQGDDSKIRERAMLGDTVRLIFVSFIVLFATVVLIPLVRLTLGPNIEAWSLEFRRVMPFRPSWCPGFFCSCWHGRPVDQDPEPGPGVPTIQLHEVRVQPKPPENRLSITAADLESALGEERSTPPPLALAANRDTDGSASPSPLPSPTGRRSSMKSESYEKKNMNVRLLLPLEPRAKAHDSSDKDEAELESGLQSPFSARSAAQPLHLEEAEADAGAQQPRVRLLLPLQENGEGGSVTPEKRGSIKSIKSGSPVAGSRGSVLTESPAATQVGRGSVLSGSTAITGLGGRGSVLSGSPMVVGRLGSALSEATPMTKVTSTRSRGTRRSSMASMASWIMPWRRRQSVAPEFETYDPRNFREAALAQQAPPPPSFSLMHVVDSTIPASQFCRTGCQPQRGG